MKKIDKKEQECLDLLHKNGYKDELGLYYLPDSRKDKIPDNEWKAMEYLTLYRGYIFKKRKNASK